MFFLLVSIMALMTGACSKKSTSDLPPQNIQGYWVGYYGALNGYPTTVYNFLFRSNGTVRVYEDATDTTQAVIAEGTYQITGSAMTATYTFVNIGDSYSVSAAVNTQYTFMNGTWGPTPTNTTGGDFLLVRQLQ